MSRRNDLCPCKSGLKFKHCCMRTRDHSKSRVENVLVPTADKLENERRAAILAARGRQIEMLHRAKMPLPWLSAFAILHRLVNNVNRLVLPEEFVKLWDELVNKYCTENGCEVPVDNSPALDRVWISSDDLQIIGAASAT